MACSIRIEGLSAQPPFAGTGAPLAITVSGRSSADCAQIRVRVRVTTAGSPVLFQAVVSTQAGGSAPGGTLPRLFVEHFYPPSALNLGCGVPLFVEAECLSDPGCADRGSFPIVCKPAPAGGGQPPGGSPPAGGGSGTPGWPWPDPPSLFCADAARRFAILLMIGTSSLAAAVAAGSGPGIAAAIALLGLAGAAYALWRHWCVPGRCDVLKAICWAMKRSFIVAIPLPFAFQNARSALLAIAFGWIAGVAVTRLRSLRCVVPSSRWSLGQLFP